MKPIRRLIGAYFHQFHEFNRKMKSNGDELPFQSFLPFLFCCGIIGGLMSIFIGLNEKDYGLLLISLIVTIIAVIGPFWLNKGINPKK